MKVFSLDKYLNLCVDTIKSLMKKEYSFYRSITTDIEVNNHKYKVCKKVNFQCRTSLHCNAKCPFCIEKDSTNCKSIKDENYINALDESLTMLKEQDIYPTITITGGEPCLYKKKLFGILDVIKKHGVEKFNLNTNALFLTEDILSKFKEVEMPHINISRHHYLDERNKSIFASEITTTEQLAAIKKSIGGTYHDKTRIRLQCVLIKDYIDSLEEVKKYLDYTIELGLDNVAFRGLSKLKESDGGNEDLHKFCDDHQVDIFGITRQLKNDSDFQLIAQNVSDHYTYEDWLYKGKVDVHFAYSDMDLLQEYELIETVNNEFFAREFVLYEDGGFCAGWNKDFKLIKQFE